MSKNPICCGLESVFVTISPSSSYYYCRECKKEVSQNEMRNLTYHGLDAPGLIWNERPTTLTPIVGGPGLYKIQQQVNNITQDVWKKLYPSKPKLRSRNLEPGLYLVVFLESELAVAPIGQIPAAGNWIELDAPCYLEGNSMLDLCVRLI